MNRKFEDVFDWDGFKKGEVVVIFKTTTEVQLFLEMCDDKNLRWNTGEVPSALNPLQDEPKAYYISCDINGLVYGSISSAMDREIVKFPDTPDVNWDSSSKIEDVFDWDDFKNGEVVVTFKTQDECQTFLNLCTKKNIMWYSGCIAQKFNPLSGHSGGCCIACNKIGLTYSTIGLPKQNSKITVFTPKSDMKNDSSCQQENKDKNKNMTEFEKKLAKIKNLEGKIAAYNKDREMLEKELEKEKSKLVPQTMADIKSILENTSDIIRTSKYDYDWLVAVEQIKEASEMQAQLRKLFAIKNALCPDYEPDWTDESNKYFIYFDFRNNNFDWDYTVVYKIVTTVYFDTEKHATTAANILNNEMKTEQK